MRQLGSRGLDEYLLSLQEEPEAAAAAERFLTVSISRFFRDRGVWRALEEHIVPALLKENREPLSVWSAGCARGEEVYTFKIVWARLRARLHPLPRLHIRATDLNPAYIAEAQKGVYRQSSLKEVPADLRGAFFRPVAPGMFAVSDEIKEGISWRVHDFISDEPPAERFEIIFLRNNLLTYYEEEIRNSAFRKIVKHLAHNGFLIIGSHENLPANELLKPSPYHPKIFKNLPPDSKT
jgi:chemotaxis protein methyltransferase CheR